MVFKTMHNYFVLKIMSTKCCLLLSIHIQDILRDLFPEKLILLCSDAAWSPHSPDLMSNDFFSLGLNLRFTHIGPTFLMISVI